MREKQTDTVKNLLKRNWNENKKLLFHFDELVVTGPDF